MNRRPPVFVDTSAWIALSSAADPYHERAKRFVATEPRLVTSNFVIDEAITFALVRHGHAVAMNLGEMLWSGSQARIIYVSKADQREAWDLFRKHEDKVFSFTDCTSFAIMHRYDLMEAFTFDSDFEQTGLFVRVPR